MKKQKHNVGIITQARMTSTRLPGKIFKEVKQKKLLEYHVDRLKKTSHQIIIATTVNKTDDEVCKWAAKENIHFYRGSEDHVLSRFYGAAKEFGLDIVVRVTSDCPLIDPGLIEKSIQKYIEMDNIDLYMSNTIERTFARGFDFEIFTFELLEDAFKNATEPSDLEHVTPYIWNNRSGKVKFDFIKQAYNHSGYRITVDTSEDFELVSKLITDHHAEDLSYSEIENILSIHPELVSINAHIDQKK